MAILRAFPTSFSVIVGFPVTVALLLFWRCRSVCWAVGYLQLFLHLSESPSHLVLLFPYYFSLPVLFPSPSPLFFFFILPQIIPQSQSPPLLVDSVFLCSDPSSGSPRANHWLTVVRGCYFRALPCVAQTFWVLLTSPIPPFIQQYSSGWGYRSDRAVSPHHQPPPPPIPA